MSLIEHSDTGLDRFSSVQPALPELRTTCGEISGPIRMVHHYGTVRITLSGIISLILESLPFIHTFTLINGPQVWTSSLFIPQCLTLPSRSFSFHLVSYWLPISTRCTNVVTDDIPKYPKGPQWGESYKDFSVSTKRHTASESQIN